MINLDTVMRALCLTALFLVPFILMLEIGYQIVGRIVKRR